MTGLPAAVKIFDDIATISNSSISKHPFFAINHIKNTQKLEKPSEFNINPFLVCLENFLCGDAKPESIAKALIYPRVLGTSITGQL